MFEINKINDNFFLSIVIPIYNEQETLPELYKRIMTSLNGAAIQKYEIIFVNDGSIDSSSYLISSWHQLNPNVKCVEFSRNFGQQTAYTAGIDNACGDVVVLMDGDLQDPPEFIPSLIKKWKEGYEIVYVIRADRKENWIKRVAFTFFYRLLNKMSSVSMPLDAGIFSLINRRVAQLFKTMPERNRYISGLRSWVGFRQIGIPCERGKRFSGKPRQTLKRLILLAVDGIFSFSYLPLRLSVLVGFVISVVSFLGVLIAIYLRLFNILSIPLGWASLIVSITFLCGLILLMLGIQGEYVARIYEEVKARPQYIVKHKIGFKEFE